jgi:SAM-dependent methyltransferase
LRYFKNKELTILYNVSDKTVRNWIAASQAGKLDLKLVKDKSRVYIADSTANNYLLEILADKGKKYRNSQIHKILKPRSEFYTLFNKTHVIDIANALDNHHQLPWDYSYFGPAAAYWNQYLNELYSAGKPNIITNTLETLDFAYNYLETYLARFKNVNVINVCVGNNVTVRQIAQRLNDAGKLRRLVALDISPAVLEIAEENARDWYNGSIHLEKHLFDIRKQSFAHILEDDTFNEDASQTVNLVFFIAGVLHTFQDSAQILTMIRNSLNKNDLLLTSIKRSTDTTHRFFDFNVKADQSILGERRRMLLSLLNIEESFYEPEQGHNHETNSAYIRIRLKVDITLNFEVSTFKKSVELRKGDVLTLWTAKRYTDLELLQLFNDVGMNSVLTTHSLDNQLLLHISKIDNH